MKTTTTTREYDAEGRMVKETVVEQETRPMPSRPVSPWFGCTCWQYTGTSSYCPLHGYKPQTITWTASTPPTVLTVNGKAIARAVNQENAKMARAR